jgi:hypothetical protein
MSHLQNIEKLHDDYSFISSSYHSLAGGLAQGYSTALKIPGAVYQAAAFPQNVVAQGMNRPDLMVKAPRWLTKNAATDFFDNAAQGERELAPESMQNITDLLADGDISGAAKAVWSKVLLNAPQQAIVIAGSLAGHPEIGLATAGAMSAADALSESSAAVESGKSKANPLEETYNMMTSGLAEVVFEKMGTVSIIDKMGKEIYKNFSKQTWDAVLKDVSKLLISSSLQEGLEEVGTTAVQEGAKHATGVDPRGIGEPGVLLEIGKESLESFYVGAASGGVMTTPAGVIAGRARIAQAQRARDIYTAMGDSVKSLRVRESLPESAQKFVESVVKDGPVENIYIDEKDIDTYFQSKNLDPVVEMK